jgi:hypothetical protein
MWNSRRASSFPLFSPAFTEISRRLISYLEPTTIRACRSHRPTPHRRLSHPLPAADIFIRKLKELRLTALTLNPDALPSAYERESQFSDETWRVRVNGTEKVNFISRVSKGIAAELFR